MTLLFRSAWLALGFTAVLAPAMAAGPTRLTPVGTPVPLITDEQRATLGIKFGPDAPIDLFRKKDGAWYLNSAGALGPVRGPGHQAAWNLHVDPGLTRILALHSDGPATGPADVETILTDHAECGARRQRLAATDPGGAACASYFDRDYAGGGTYFRCPDGQTSVYFYHGENHTAPDGAGGHGGWFGIGVAVYDAGETSVRRAAQMPVPGGEPSAEIVGVNLPTRWDSAPGSPPPQAHPFNGVPSAIPGADGYLYLYNENATQDPAYNPSACRPECPSVSRAPVAAFCRGVRTGTPVAWQNYYRGAWTSPAVLTGTPEGFGTGGAFTPLIPQAEPGEYGGTETYLPARHLFVMVRLIRGGIDARTSLDGLHWSDPQPLLDAPRETTPNGDAEQAVYPRVSVVHDAQGREGYALTYALVTKGHFWRWAEFMRQDLSAGP